MERNQKAILVLIVVISTLLLFQNCGPQMISNIDTPSTVEYLTDKPIIPDCQFNRNNMFEGDSVIAYQTSAVPATGNCVSETRVCRGGKLTGSFQFPSCLPGVPSACFQNGVVVGHGRPQNFYQSNSVPYGGTCVSEERICNNGSLSGSFGYLECTVQNPSDCLVGGVRVPNGRPKLLFKSASVPYGSACESESRECQNGNFVNGTFTELTCSVDLPKDCIHGDQTLRHNTTTNPFYKSSAVPFGQTCTLGGVNCFNGAVTGDTTFTATTCVVQAAADCSLYDGTSVAHMGTVIAYQFDKVALDDDCEKYTKVLSCNNKVLSPAANASVYKYSKCSASLTKDCTLPDGSKINHGDSATLKKYKYTLENDRCDDSWNVESVSCNNGILSGTARFRTCQPVQPQLLTPAGGGGGSPYENRCQSSGARGVGIHGASGTNIDRVGVRCSVAPDAGTSGGSGGGSFSTTCPAGKFLVGLTGTTSTNYFFGSGVVRSIQPYCANADGSAGEFVQNQGVGGTYAFYQICPPGSVVIGFKGRSGSLVDQIQVMCGKMVEGANINCVGRWINQGCEATFKGAPIGNKAQRYFHTQPAGGNGSACPFPDGEFQEIEDGCGTGGGVER